MENLDFKFDYKIPDLSSDDKKLYFNNAQLSERKRFPYIIHKKGDEFNQVFNFVLEDSYMIPHMHPASNMVEKMHLIEGSFKLIFFNDSGKPTKSYNIDKRTPKVQVPGFTWHTYVMTSSTTIIFETMMGKYSPLTWKKMAGRTPDEKSSNSNEYLQFLKNIDI